MFKYAWEQASYDFMCMKSGQTLEWILDNNGVHLFIDDHEIDLEAEV